MTKKEVMKEFSRLIPPYQESILKLKKIMEEPVPEISPLKSCSFPINYWNEIQWLIHYCQENNLDISDIPIDFTVSNHEIDEIIHEHQDTYLLHINHDIAFLLDQFHPGSFFLDSFEFETKIGERTLLEDLLGEVSRYRSIDEEREKIFLQDEIFRKLIPDLIRINYYNPNDIFYAPDEYWWLHLEEFYGPDSINVKRVLRRRVHEIRRWYDSFSDNRIFWHSELYPNPGHGDYEKWRDYL